MVPNEIKDTRDQEDMQTFNGITTYRRRSTQPSPSTRIDDKDDAEQFINQRALTK